jgi:pilus assembly protein CpaB
MRTDQQTQLSARTRRLLSTRRGIITVAIGPAVLGGAILVLFLSAYRNSITGSDGTREVMVAKVLISEGSVADAIAENNMYEFVAVEKAEIVDGAIEEPEAIRGKVTKSAIYPGEQVTASDFRAQTSSLGDQIQGQERAVSLPFNEFAGLVGHLEDGDRVDVIGLFRLRPESAGIERPISRIIMQDVLVLKGPDEEPGETDEESAVVLRAESDMDAADLAFTAEYGMLWLGLRPKAGAKETARPSPNTVDNVVFGLAPIPAQQFRRQLGGRR